MSELSDAFDDWLTETVTVETYTGPTAYGADYLDARDVPELMANFKRTYVRNTEGQMQLCTFQIMGEPELAEYFTPQSKVTYGDRSTVVVAVSTDSHEFPVMVVNCE